MFLDYQEMKMFELSRKQENRYSWDPLSPFIPDLKTKFIFKTDGVVFNNVRTRKIHNIHSIQIKQPSTRK